MTLVAVYIVLISIFVADGQDFGRNFERILFDRYATVPEIIKSRGYGCEVHETTTVDGYILTLFRIVNPLRSKRGKPVLLVHGFFGSSIGWVIQGSGGDLGDGKVNGTVENMLGFALARRGYDVWLANMRGTVYSLGHERFVKDDPDYWLFSRDEYYSYDCPAFIDYVLDITKYKTLGYVSYSLGGQMLFVLMSQQPKYNRIIRPFIALAPLVYADHVGGSLKYSSSETTIRTLIANPGPTGQNSPTSKALTLACAFPPVVYVCALNFWIQQGYNAPQLEFDRLNVYLAQAGGVSNWAIAQAYQGAHYHTFRKFDFLDEARNLKAYGQPVPPDYHPENITSKYICIIHSVDDVSSDPQDIEKLKKTLKVPLLYEYLVTAANFTHADFVWGKNTGVLVYGRVINLLRKYL